MNFDLKAWRKEHNLSQRVVAEGCGVYMNAIVKFEKTGKISARTEKKLQEFVKRYQDGGVYTSKEEYKPALMEIDSLCKFLPADIKYIAIDESNEAYGFKEEPKYSYGNKEWASEFGCVKIPLNINFEGVLPENSLVKRPYNYFDFIGKYGLFFDKDEESPIFGKLEYITGNGNFCREGCAFTYANFRPLSEAEKENLA